MLLLSGCTFSRDTEIFLTDEEINWLNEHEGQIKIGYTTDYPPIEFLKDGEYVGISADYFRLLEEKLDFKIEMVRYDSWPELLEDAKNKKVSGITAASKTEQRLEYFNFTVPYIFNPNVIITRKNFSEKLTFEKLNNSSMSIVAIEGFSVLDELKLNYPNLNYRTVSNAKEGLRKVSFGEADAMIVQLISASLSIDEDNITNLMVNSETTYDSNLSIATRNDWPILNDIFNKGLAQITDSEKNAIKSKWVPLYQDNFYDNPYFLPILIAIIGFFIFLFIIIFLWTITLKKKVREKTAELEKSKEELYFKSYHDDLTKLYNRAYYNEQIEYYALNPALPFTIIIADLNGLKIVNDTFGHEKGDLLIQKAADILKEQCREKDVLARIGGDEFVILMPQASCEDGLALCENIKQACLNADKYPIAPSIALGVATQIHADESLQEVFNKAEDMMYENKKNYRDKTYLTFIDSLKYQLNNLEPENSDQRTKIQNLAIELGKRLSLSEKEINELIELSDL